jgi:hypothetical protein
MSSGRARGSSASSCFVTNARRAREPGSSDRIRSRSAACWAVAAVRRREVDDGADADGGPIPPGVGLRDDDAMAAPTL